jgi:ASC-1-like (ASCH) protein
MIQLRFREYPIFELIKVGKKTVETRALNPEEPDRYFGNVQIGDNIELYAVDTGEALVREVVRVTIYNSFEEYLEREDLGKIFGSEVSKETATEKHLSFPGYEEKLRKNGIIAFEIK